MKAREPQIQSHAGIPRESISKEKRLVSEKYYNSYYSIFYTTDELVSRIYVSTIYISNSLKGARMTCLEVQVNSNPG